MRLPRSLPPCAGLPRAGLAAAVLLAACLPAGELQAREKLCRAEVESHLAELPLAEGDVKSLRIIERVNLDEFGPDILGVEGWVRLNSCSGWRSEEHTSELQSLMRISYAVFCLKKNKRQ